MSIKTTMRIIRMKTKFKMQKSPPKEDPIQRRAGLPTVRQAPLEEKSKLQVSAEGGSSFGGKIKNY
jgi:hypothetical protein